jgi:hypothetical protein
MYRKSARQCTCTTPERPVKSGLVSPGGINLNGAVLQAKSRILRGYIVGNNLFLDPTSGMMSAAEVSHG